MENKSTLENSHLKLIIWAAMLMSNFLFVGLIFTLSSTPSEPVDPVLIYTIAFLGLITLAMSVILPKIIKPNSESEANFEIVRFILSLALNEVCTIFGFVIGFVFHDNKTAFVLIGISIIGHLMKFPKNTAEANSKNSLDI